MHKQSLLATFYFTLAVLLQATIGNFPLSLAFPFNVIWIMAWGYLLQHLYKEGSRPILSRLFTSITHKNTFYFNINWRQSDNRFISPVNYSDVDAAFMSGDLYNHNN